MANCPVCGKPLKKNHRKSKYYCENRTCSVIFVCHPEEPSRMKITYNAKAHALLEVKEPVPL